MTAADSEWLSASKLTAMLGVTNMTIWRWERNVRLAFPTPSVINARRYWNRNDINSWMRDMAARNASTASSSSNRRA